MSDFVLAGRWNPDVPLSAIGRQMEGVDECPACGHQERSLIDRWTDLQLKLPRSLRSLGDARYSICSACTLIYATRRQPWHQLPEFYRFFSSLENQVYDQYPPPSWYRESKYANARWILGLEPVKQKLRQAEHVWHIRSDFGSLLQLLRDDFKIPDLWGWDFFENNLRYARADLGHTHTALLSIDVETLDLPSEPADLIVSNHMLTHAPCPASLLRFYRKCLAPQGELLVYFEDDHLRSFRKKLRGGQSPKRLNGFHLSLLHEEALLNLVRLTGWTVVDMGSYKERLWAVLRPAPVATPVALTSETRTDVEATYREYVRSRRRLEWERRLFGRRGLRGGLEQTGRRIVKSARRLPRAVGAARRRQRRLTHGIWKMKQRANKRAQKLLHVGLHRGRKLRAAVLHAARQGWPATGR